MVVLDGRITLTGGGRSSRGFDSAIGFGLSVGVGLAGGVYLSRGVGSSRGVRLAGGVGSSGGVRSDERDSSYEGSGLAEVVGWDRGVGSMKLESAGGVGLG